MKTRRGTDMWPGHAARMITRYSVGDVVVSTTTGSLPGFTGEVMDISEKTNKVMVAWGGGTLGQHDPDEIMLHPYLNTKRSFDASDFRRGRKAQLGPQFSMGDFVLRYLQFYNQLNVFHWQTVDFAQHKAFDEVAEEIEELMDGFVESYQGIFGRFVLEGPSLGLMNYGGDQPVETFATVYHDYLQSVHDVTGSSELTNILEEMVALVDKLLYLLTLD